MEPHLPRIAVIYATARGSTCEIAEFIADSLRGRGATVELADVEHAPELSRFDVVVLGSAVHNMALLPSIEEYIRHHTENLNVLPVWLYSVGIGPALRGPIGRRIGAHVPKKIAALRDTVCPVEYASFAGHYERVGVSLPARTLYRLMGGGRYGDLRDWNAIIGWTTSIGDTLRLPQPLSIPTHP